ncbi:MAG: hypothetical protein FWB74_07070 [Defluviitaleaceae bacterium]|nr:hypothetical protein [Defluviitaleaceae bacterium]
MLKKIILLAFILLTLGGCRVRISDDLTESPPVETPQDEYIEEVPEDAPNYDEYVSLPYIQAAHDALSPLELQIETEDARRSATEAIYESDENPTALQSYELENNVITIELPAEVYDDAVIGADGGVVGLIAAYSTLLRQGVNSIFPCQLKYVYTETASDLVTAGRGSVLYQLITNAGGINVSSRLAPAALHVTADWVVRRNPDLIVKFVNDGTSHHETIQSLTSRPDWGTIEAVRNGGIILFSENILEHEETKLAATLLIAATLYPELFEGIDVTGAVSGLIAYTEGILIYIYNN